MSIRISAGGAVGASSFRVVAPTTSGVRKAYPLTAINNWTGEGVCDLLQTGDIRIKMALTVPETYAQVICVIPPLCRPKTERKIIGFNGDTPVAITVSTSGELKCVSTIEGVLTIKDTYDC